MASNRPTRNPDMLAITRKTTYKLLGAIVNRLSTSLPRESSPHLYLLAGLFMLLFFLYNYTNLTGINWFVHPDDYASWLMAHHVFHTGQFVIANPLNESFNCSAFTPTGLISIGSRVLPGKALGEYLLLVPGFIFGDLGPFYIIPITGILGIIFFYFLVRDMYGGNVALLATFLFGFSFPVIYWSNMLFPNIPAISFFIVGLYFLTRLKRKENAFYNYILCFFFLSLVVWMRYEYIILIPLLFPFFILNWNRLNKRWLVVSLSFFLLLLSPILWLNNTLYGSPFVYGQTAFVKINEALQGVQPVSIWSYLIEGFLKVFHFALGQTMHPDFGKIVSNASDWIYAIFPAVTLLGTLGLIFGLREYKRHELLVSLLVISIVWLYIIGSGSFFGEGTSIVGSNYIRYFLVIYASLAIGAALMMRHLSRLLHWHNFTAIVAMLLIVHNISTIGLLYSQNLGLQNATEQKIFYHRITTITRELPLNSVVITNVLNRAITDRDVLSTQNIKGDPDQKISTTIDYIEGLLNQNYEVFIMEAAAHQATYLDLQGHIQKEKPDLELREILFDEPIGRETRVYQVLEATK